MPKKISLGGTVGDPGHSLVRRVKGRVTRAYGKAADSAGVERSTAAAGRAVGRQVGLLAAGGPGVKEAAMGRKPLVTQHPRDIVSRPGAGTRARLREMATVINSPTIVMPAESGRRRRRK